MADHREPPQSEQRLNNNAADQLRDQVRQAFRQYMLSATAANCKGVTELDRIVREELAAIDKCGSLLTDAERDALLKCAGRPGGEEMERLIMRGLIEHGECKDFHPTLEFVSCRGAAWTETGLNRTLCLPDVKTLQTLATYERRPLKVTTDGGRGSDIFYLTRVDTTGEGQVSFMLIESKFGVTPLDNGKRGRLANGEKSSKNTNRVMPEILNSLREAAISIRNAITAALHLRRSQCTFELVLACGSPINQPAYERLVSDRRVYPVRLWYHDYLWNHVWEERVKAFLLEHYDQDKRRASYLHHKYDVTKAAAGSRKATIYSKYPDSVLRADYDEDKDEDQDEDEDEDEDEDSDEDGESSRSNADSSDDSSDDDDE